MLYLLFDEFLLLLTEVHLVHLDHELVPGLFLLDFLGLLLGVLRLDVGLHAFCPLSSAVGWLLMLSSRLGRLGLLSSCLLSGLLVGIGWLLRLPTFIYLLSVHHSVRWVGSGGMKQMWGCYLN